MILPFKIKLGKTIKIIPHPKVAKAMKIIAEDEDFYSIYFHCMTLFSKIILKIFPDK
jgi:hypothetical protein